jgi:hypothetical protein
MPKGPIIDWMYDDLEDLTNEELALKRIWRTKKGELIKYEDIEDRHLDNIINMLETKDTTRKAHLKGIKEEKLRRTGIIGEILYGNHS